MIQSLFHSHQNDRKLYLNCFLSLFISIFTIGIFASSKLHASKLDTSQENLSKAYKSADKIHQNAIKSQQRIDKTVSSTNKLTQQYEILLKNIESLKIYNQQKRVAISEQKKIIKNINTSIQNVDKIQRQISPLMLKMLAFLKEFISLDVPFYHEKRLQRVADLESLMNTPKVSTSEKFTQLLNVYTIENEYGNTIEAWEDNITINGTTQLVKLFRVGRISLMYLSLADDHSGLWDQSQKKWVPLPEKYNSQIKNAIQMAKKIKTIDMMILPFNLPESI